MRAAKLVIVIVMLFATSCASNAESAAHHSFTLVGSTPCDDPITTALGLRADTKCDFMRWTVAIDASDRKTFALNIDYGLSQPNTLGFTSESQRKLSASGKLETIKRPNRREVYRLRVDPDIDVSIARLNANIFQLLMPNGSMMVGNGGWSYTLNRSTPIANADLPVGVADAQTTIVLPREVFEGRTPCNELKAIVREHRDSSCFKIQWLITLDRDPMTYQPTTFAIKGIIPDRTREITGKWTVYESAGLAVIRLQPDGGLPGVSLLKIDGNLLLFLDDKGRPLVGNKDFSFTLNRKP
jgi:hypothetical protein